ncbi:MAG: hypothetical protein AAF281_13905 [Pseudomonadota bacterium]
MFFSYGMTKCGSTLAFQLVRVALIEAGCPQDVIAFPGMPAGQRINFIGQFTEAHRAQLERELDMRGYPIAIKTHTRPSPQEVYLMESGLARAHAVYRDLRDMALSLLDAGQAAEAKGKRAFAEMRTLDDAKAGIDNQLDTLSAWLQLPGVRRLPFDRLASQTELAAAQVLDQLGLDGNPARIARRVLRAEFTQFNKGIPHRHRREMAAADSAAFLDRYAPFYDLVWDSAHQAPPLPPGTTLSRPEAAPA